MANPLFSFDPITPRVARINGQVTQAYRDLSTTIDVCGGGHGARKAVTRT